MIKLQDEKEREISFYRRGRNYPNHNQKKARSEMLLTDEIYARYLTFNKPLKFSMFPITYEGTG